MTNAEVEQLLPQADLARAVKSNLAVYRCLVEEIDGLGKIVKQRLKLRPNFQSLLTVDGIGPILGMTIMLETGAIGTSQGWVSLPPIAGVWIVASRAKANARVAATPRTGTNIVPVHGGSQAAIAK